MSAVAAVAGRCMQSVRRTPTEEMAARWRHKRSVTVRNMASDGHE
jgi:hypothetical protein